jgi:hypothetical protein
MDSQTTTRLDALSAEITRLVDREIQSVRANTHAAPRDAEALQTRLRLENTVRDAARQTGEAIERIGRLVGYLHEHAQRTAAANAVVSLHAPNVVPDVRGEKSA